MLQAIGLGILVVLMAGLNTSAQICMKLGAGPEPINGYVASGIGMYGLSTVLYILTLGQLNLSFIYPIIIGLTIIATLLGSSFLLREPVAMGQWVGVGLMLSGLMAITVNHSS